MGNKFKKKQQLFKTMPKIKHTKKRSFLCTKNQEVFERLYTILLKEFGPRGWWPILNAKTLHGEYYLNAPRNNSEKFEIAIGAILTQNTNWKNVEKALANLKKNKKLNKKTIKEMKQEKLAELIRPAGYFNQKAKKLKIFANLNKEITRENLLALWGLGPETVDSILLYAYNQPFFVVDTYTKKILAKLNVCDENISYEELQNLFHNNLKKNTKLFKEYHALLVQLGKHKCKAPCPDCPVERIRKQLK